MGLPFPFLPLLLLLLFLLIIIFLLVFPLSPASLRGNVRLHNPTAQSDCAFVPGPSGTKVSGRRARARLLESPSVFFSPTARAIEDARCFCTLGSQQVRQARLALQCLAE